MEDKFLVGEYEDKIFVQFIGNATMKNSKTIEELFDNIFAGEKKEIIIDFKDCNYMDSTMLGFLAKTAIKLKKVWNKQMFEFNAINMVKASLKSTGVYNLMEHLDEFNGVVQLTELQVKDFSDKGEKARHILDAHKTLMSLSEENEKVFKNVVDLLEKDIKK